VDWEQQEFGIAAALSGDSAMQEAYLSGDPYLAFAKQARAVPPDATKETHPKERSRFKVCALGVQYGMGEQSLAMALSEPVATARELLRLHRQTYGKFWQWSASAVSFAMLSGCLHTVFGWTVHVGPDVNPRSLANFPMQGNGAEMLRLACCMATEQEIRVCAPVHDALLIESDIGRIGDKVRATQDAMQTASRAVLNGFPLRTEAKIISYPERYADDRGREMWQAVTSILHSIQLRGNTRFGDTLAVPETDVQLAVSGIPAPSIVW
jgi:DNA polymerase I-like protein with 3'-5' exonuclease and polymerase domains